MQASAARCVTHGACRARLGPSPSDVVVAEVELEHQLLRLVRGQAELAGDCGLELRAAPLEHAREVADDAVGDRERRAVVAESTPRRPRPCSSSARPRRDGAQQRERLEVDRRRARFRRLAGRDVVVDRLAVGGGEEDAARDAARLVDALADDVVVDHRLVDRDRERLVRAEADRVRELALVVDPSTRGRGRRPGSCRCRGERRAAGSLCCVKNSSSAGASAGMSRTSPPTTMPGSSGLRASCTSFAGRRC